MIRSCGHSVAEDFRSRAIPSLAWAGVSPWERIARLGGDKIPAVIRNVGEKICCKTGERGKKAYQVQIIANHSWLFLFYKKKKKGFKEENCSPAVTSAATVMPGDT